MANGDASAAGGRANGLPTSEPRWPSSVAVLVAVALYALLPKEIVSGSFGGYVVRFAAPVLELALLVPLAVTTPHRRVNESGRRRKVAIALIAVISAANIVALGFLVH